MSQPVHLSEEVPEMVQRQNAKRRLPKLNSRAKVFASAFASAIYVCASCAVSLHRDESMVGAAMRGDVSEVRQLLDRGANPNALFDGSVSALVQAVQKDDIATAELLLQRGADPDLMTSEGVARRIAQSKEMKALFLRFPRK